MNNTHIPLLKGDPSDLAQIFPKYEVNLLCCRYWWLENWEFRDLSFPFWRIYHNNFEGASIIYKEQKISITPDKLILIAPNTSYSTRLYNHKIPQTGYLLKGGRVDQTNADEKSQLLHLFIHFNLGVPYDYANMGIYSVPINEELCKMLSLIKEHLCLEASRFNFNSTIAVNSVISQLLSTLPKSGWQLASKDYRILQAIHYIEEHPNDILKNPQLARIASMSTNAFIRLFTQETGISPQKYVKGKRIDKACILLHHSNMSIDEVAAACGFADRYHFSRSFKQITNHSPAMYKKGGQMMG
ncbi:MAG: helix-turn-helix domain-containing protein [Bacteroidales bacterium]